MTRLKGHLKIGNPANQKTNKNYFAKGVFRSIGFGSQAEENKKCGNH